jgi:hypothetical protein
MKCNICKTDYYRQTDVDPQEPCWCGECCSCSPWGWDRWRGVRLWVRFKIASLVYRLYAKILGKYGL